MFKENTSLITAAPPPPSPPITSTNQSAGDDDSSSQSSLFLYENDFDLYNILKDMNTSVPPHLQQPQQQQQRQMQSRPKRRNSFKKNVTKSLTARLLDSHFTNGKNEWSLIENGMDLYRSKIKCIGTDTKDFGNGDAVFLDLQPLSTRIKLMCKLIIIIQGACLERSGPPKLVQDRCLQFDGSGLEQEDLNASTNTLAAEPVNPTAAKSGGGGSVYRKESFKIKANSCENLLNDLNGSHLTKNELIIDDNEHTKITVFGTSYTNANATNAKLNGKASFRAEKRVKRKKSYRNNVESAMSDDESLLNNKNSHVGRDEVKNINLGITKLG